MFAGIGPFAVPSILKTGCTVHANDLNPESFKYLNVNKALNKIPEDKLITYNLDGAEFVKTLIQNNIYFNHVIMNLPASAYTFLPVFKGIFNTEYCNAKIEDPKLEEEPKITEDKKKKSSGPKITQKQLSIWPKLENNMPWIHCYGFSAAEDPLKDFLQTVENTIGAKLPDARVKEVRDVSPHKRMILVSFPLPLSVGLNENNKRKLSSPPGETSEIKKQKLK